MDIKSLITGFNAYLESLNELSNKDYNTKSESASVFLYSKEFKTYVADELNIDTSIFSKNINDILDMEVVNGKLVSKEENSNSDTFTPSTENNQDKPTNELENESNVSPEGETTNPVKTNEESIILEELINSLLENKDVISVLDSDKDKELNDEEISAFIEKINKNDGDEKNLSLEDILQGIEELKTTIEENKIEEENTEVEDVEENTVQNEIPTLSSGNSGGGGGGGSYSGSSSSGTNNNKSNVTQANSLDNKSLEELQSMLPDAETKVETAESELDTAMDAVNNNEYKEAVDEALKNYTDFLETIQEKNDDFAKQIQDKNTEIDDCNKRISETDRQLVDCLAEESSLETTISDADSSIATLTESKNSITSAIAGAEGEEKTALQSKLTNIETKIGEQQKKRDAAQKKLDTLQQDTIPKLEETKATEESNLETLEKELTDLMDKAEEKYPELKEYREQYDAAQKTYEEEKVKAEEDVNTALGNLAAAQNELNALNTAITKAETKEAVKENSVGALSMYDSKKGNEIAAAAESLYGNVTSAGGYCARGVSQAIEKALGISMSGDAYEWAGNLENCDEFVEITDEISLDDFQTLPAGAVICWSQYEAGHTPSNGKYGHVCISDGKGHEISDFKGSRINTNYADWGAEYRVFIPA